MHSDTEVVFFLGDGISDIEEIASSHPAIFFIAVRGNCDLSYSFLSRPLLKTEEITLDGNHILLTHGDLYGVKAGLSELCSLAESRGADIILFGHTHTPLEKYFSLGERSYYIFNPGSASVRDRSYGILTTGKTPFFSVGRID